LFLVLIALLCGLEGQQWRRQKLTREGKHLADIVSGDSSDDAEIHFFHRWTEGNVPAPVAALATTPVPIHNPSTQTAFGLFPEPEKWP
jgi:hypothetical protein